MISRRSFLRAGVAILAAPAIVKAESLMAVKAHGARFVPVSNYGSYFYFESLSNYLRMETQSRVRFRQFASTPNMPEPKGDTFAWNVYGGDTVVVPEHMKDKSEAAVLNEMLRQRRITDNFDKMAHKYWSSAS